MPIVPHANVLMIRVALLALVSAVAIIDLHTRRIPNLLTVPGALLGLALNGAAAGEIGIAHGCAGLVLAMAMFVPFFVVGHVGAGDVKAIAAVGAFVGARGTLIAVIWILLAGGVAAVVSVMARRFRQPSADAGPHRFPYGVAIACGTVAALAWSGA